MGWEGRKRRGGWEGGGREGRGKGRRCGGTRKVVCPGARAGSRRACLATKLNEQHDCHITGRMADIFFSFTCFTLHLPESHSYSWDKTFFVIYISTIEQPAVVNVGTAITVPPVGLCDTQSYV